MLRSVYNWSVLWIFQDLTLSFRHKLFARSPLFQNFWTVVSDSSYMWRATFSWRFTTTGVSSSSETQGQSVGSEKRRDKSFQVRAKERLGTDSHRTISKNSRRCQLLIGHKKMLCIIVPNRRTVSLEFFSWVCTRRLLSRSRLVWLMHQRNARSQETFSLI